MYALAAVLTVLAIVAVILRFYARRVKKVRPSWDDYLIVLALVTFFRVPWIPVPVDLQTDTFKRSPLSAQQFACSSVSISS